MQSDQTTQNRDSASRAVGVLQVVLGTVTPLALISIGGLGIYGAPILLPLLWITANASRGAGRWYFTALAALVAVETAWAISWSLAPTLQLPVPIIAAAATAVLFVKTSRLALSIRTTLVIVALLGLLGLAGIAALAGNEETRMREVEFDRSNP